LPSLIGSSLSFKFWFNSQTLYIFGFSYFNQILLSLLNVSNAFQESFLVIIEINMSNSENNSDDIKCV